MAEKQPFGLLTEGSFAYDLDDVPVSVGVEMALNEAAARPALLNERIVAKWNELIAGIDLRQALRKLAYRGFDSLDDYEKYGDMYVALDVRPCGTGTR